MDAAGEWETAGVAEPLVRLPGDVERRVQPPHRPTGGRDEFLAAFRECFERLAKGGLLPPLQLLFEDLPLVLVPHERPACFQLVRCYKTLWAAHWEGLEPKIVLVSPWKACSTFWPVFADV